MHKPTVLFAVGCAALLAACSSGEAAQQTANIAKVADVKSSFGPEFTVTEVPMTGIDPKVLAAQKLPEGLKFEPADCAKFAVGPQFPAEIKGNMTALSAEGAGNRFITIALETSEPIPVDRTGGQLQEGVLRRRCGARHRRGRARPADPGRRDPGRAPGRCRRRSTARRRPAKSTAT